MCVQVCNVHKRESTASYDSNVSLYSMQTMDYSSTRLAQSVITDVDVLMSLFTSVLKGIAEKTS